MCIRDSYIGEKVGQGGPNVDIALDPLEGTTITAKGGENAMAVIALAQEGGFLNAPDVYMRKISAKVENENVVSLNQDLRSNIKALAEYKKINTEDLVIFLIPTGSDIIIIGTTFSLLVFN